MRPRNFIVLCAQQLLVSRKKAVHVALGIASEIDAADI